jgi:hypothetical protein
MKEKVARFCKYPHWRTLCANRGPPWGRDRKAATICQGIIIEFLRRFAGARLPQMRHRIEQSVPGCAEGPQLLVGEPPLEPLGQALAIKLGADLMQAGVKGFEAGARTASGETVPAEGNRR